jgi:hypothetical protein
MAHSFACVVIIVGLACAFGSAKLVLKNLRIKIIGVSILREIQESSCSDL